MSRPVPSNTYYMIDSRDIIARIRELEADRDDFITAREEAEEQAANGEREPLTDDEFTMDEDDAAELTALKALEAEASSSSDWQHGAILIADWYFEDYAREMASDLYGREIDDARWPFDCIDWERAAEALQQDYTSVEWAGVTYWLR